VILVSSVSDEFSFRIPEDLVPFETLDSIVKSGVAWINFERVIRVDFGSAPALLSIPIDFQDVVSGGITKFKSVIESWLDFLVAGQGDLEILTLGMLTFETLELL
jgi:hypothetical protein